MGETTIPVKVNSRIWWQLASMAEQRDERVADVIAEAIDLLLNPPPVRTVVVSRESRRFSDADSVRLRDLTEQGFTIAEIAAVLGFHPNTVMGYRSRLGITGRMGRRSQIQNERREA